MNEQQIKVIVAEIKNFTTLFGRFDLPMSEYVELILALAKNRDFTHYRVFDQFTSLEIKPMCEQMAIVSVSGVINDHMTQWLNNKLTMCFSAAKLAA